MYVKDIRVVKNNLRNKYKAVRRNMPPAQKHRMDVEIQSRLLSLRQYHQNDLLFTYVSKDIEVDTLAIIAAARANKKRVAVPRCVPGEIDMEFFYIRGEEDLAPGMFGVLEPVPERCELVTDFSRGLCIVPGLSFDAEGFRLGYGKGYYDRFLSQFQGITVGLCYSNCTQWRLPHGRYDRPVDLLITDRYLRKTARP